MKRHEINIRDPYVLVVNGKYYMYGTRGATCWGKASGFDVYVSDDLETWSNPIPCFENDGSFWADRNYWAPEVHPYKGKYYMFASFKNETVCRGTAILVSDSPVGPFVPHSDGCVTPREWECLDGTFYVDKSGNPYMVFCHEWVQAGDGEICAVRLSEDLKKAVSKPRLLFRASEPEWVKSLKNAKGEDCYVTDGPFMWRCGNGNLLCLWASFSEGGYTEAVAISDNGEIDGNFRHIDPIFAKDGGHGMVFKGLDGKMYLTLHSPNTNYEERPHFHEITEDNGTLKRV
ncbi:MAG: family 43 glycosylhydrolase [Clostridia bacterium]|nr:family 43 glycosylhydrolase [Clostridia bacterium]